MTLVAGLGTGVFVLVGLVVGVRLLALARRTRQAPELLIGATLLAMGPVGFPCALVALRIQAEVPLAGSLLLGFAVAALAAGTVCLVRFTQGVFRPGERWARGLALSFALGLAACWCTSAWMHGFDLRGRALDGPGYAGFVLRAGALVWAGFEALRYWRMMRRRLALGLADPVTTDRFMLWGVAAATAAGINILIVLTMAGDAAQVAISDVLALVTSALGMVASVALWLAFLPPRIYLEHVRLRAPAPAGAP